MTETRVSCMVGQWLGVGAIVVWYSPSEGGGRGPRQTAGMVERGGTCCRGFGLAIIHGPDRQREVAEEGCGKKHTLYILSCWGVFL